jgi:hypothetical protein
LARQLAVDWKQHAPAKSAVTKLLENQVRAYQRRVRQEEAAVRCAMVGQGGRNTPSSSATAAGGATSAAEANSSSRSSSSGGSSGGAGVGTKKKGVGQNGNTTGFEPEDLNSPQLSPWEVRASELYIPCIHLEDLHTFSFAYIQLFL